MKNVIIFIYILLSTSYLFSGEIESRPRADEYTISLARSFSKELFELNGIPYLKPMVESMNATSNSGFFNQAYVPKKVSTPYFRFGLKGMLGFVRPDMKTYSPGLPSDSLDLVKLGKLINFEIDYSDPRNPKFNVKSIPDTAALILYALKVYAHRGIQAGLIPIPETAPTILGYGYANIELKHSVLDSLIKSYPIVPVINKPLLELLPDSLRANVERAINQFPEFFTLPAGGNINTLIAGIPQIEIGSLWGTELLVRFIPPVYMGTNVGDFAFWGIGLKHSISQYFQDEPDNFEPGKPYHDNHNFNLAVQAVYQGTYLKNEVGETKAQLKANATIWDFNIHASQSIPKIVDFYTGLSLELLTINSDFYYTLPTETQFQLGLIEREHIGYDYRGWKTYRNLPPDPSRGFTGDDKPQTAFIRLTDTNLKWMIGLTRQIGPVAIFFDYSISKFNIMSGGIEIRF